MVISGPNAGGKTVTLKTVGLLQLMVQSGLLVPVHPDSEMGIFKQIMIHIGDTQSLEFELSTYSSHLKNMKHFMENANGKLNREYSTKKMELDIVTSTTVNQMWTNELDKLSQEYLEYKEERERLMSGMDIKSKKKVVSKGLVSKGVVTKKNVKNLVVIEE